VELIGVRARRRLAGEPHREELAAERRSEPLSAVMPTSAKRPITRDRHALDTMPAAAARPVVSVIGTVVVAAFIVKASAVVSVRSRCS